ncbi:VanZ family protein [Aquimarina muelleri]|uniref:VanZ-like domain-containing protein n=1 Tax=Aquimarina muelleri TaxID=279356 RepID=A0A918JWI2_9FLAO|nr:VanZ family protein [Aquimarina muelleri]MCX2761441.1 VanZ family protein [Aquimarina muelleri]GGX13731.1 hypothetical protein GCM10007384_14140 [Aquimarina muelleri]
MDIKKLLEGKNLFTLAISFTVLLAWVSLAKFSSSVVKVKGGDKIGHFFAYFILTILWSLFFFFSKNQNKNLKQSLGIATVLCVFFGIMMELFQGILTTYRNSDWYDIIANTSGTIFAIFIFILIKDKLINFKQNNQITS